MVPGHFGLAAGVKSQVPAAPLWALMLATHWLDVFFVPLFLAGIETITPLNPANPNAYGGGVIHAVYTHSLVGALLTGLMLLLFVTNVLAERMCVLCGTPDPSHDRLLLRAAVLAGGTGFILSPRKWWSQVRFMLLRKLRHLA